MSVSRMAKYLGINRLGRLFQAIREAGGLKQAYLKLYRWAKCQSQASYISCKNSDYDRRVNKQKRWSEDRHPRRHRQVRKQVLRESLLFLWPQSLGRIYTPCEHGLRWITDSCRMVRLDALQGTRSKFPSAKLHLSNLSLLQTDLPPIRDGCRPKYKWIADHSENLSGTKGKPSWYSFTNHMTYYQCIFTMHHYHSHLQLSEAYMPYSTTPPKVEAWQPKPCKK